MRSSTARLSLCPYQIGPAATLFFIGISLVKAIKRSQPVMEGVSGPASQKWLIDLSMCSIAKAFKVLFCVSTINADFFPHLIFHIGDKPSRQFIRIFMSLSVSRWVVSFSFLSVINSIVNDLPALHSTKQCLVTFPLYLSPHSGKIGIPPKFPSNRYLFQWWQFPKLTYSLIGALPHIIVVVLQRFFLLLIRCKCCHPSITNQLLSIFFKSIP